MKKSGGVERGAGRSGERGGVEWREEWGGVMHGVLGFSVGNYTNEKHPKQQSDFTIPRISLAVEIKPAGNRCVSRVLVKPIFVRLLAYSGECCSLTQYTVHTSESMLGRLVVATDGRTLASNHTLRQLYPLVLRHCL